MLGQLFAFHLLPGKSALFILYRELQLVDFLLNEQKSEQVQMVLRDIGILLQQVLLDFSLDLFSFFKVFLVELLGS